MKKDLLKKMKYEMPGAAAKKPMEGAEIEISMEGPEAEDTGMPDLAAAEAPEGEEDMGEVEGMDLSGASDEELLAEIKKRKLSPS